MKNFIFGFLFICSTFIYSQIEVDTTLKKGWNPNAIIGLNLSQISFKDWAQGGSNSLSYTAFSKVDIYYITDYWRWANFLKLAFGRTKLESQGFRTTDNELFFESILSRNLGWKIDPYFSSSVRSSLTKGYDYKTTPETQTAAFFDPGYLTQSIGFIYHIEDRFSSRLGISIQETFANKFAAIYTDNKETPDKVEKLKVESGLESVTTLVYEFLPNITYATYLKLFTRFDKLDVWDVRWDNYINAKVNEYVNVNINVLILHEISQTRRTQIKNTLALGITYKIL